MSTSSHTEPHGLKRLVSAFAGRWHALFADLAREEMILERERFDEEIQRDAEQQARRSSPRKSTAGKRLSSTPTS